MVGWLSLRRRAAALSDPSAAIAANRRRSSQFGFNPFKMHGIYRTVWNVEP